MLCLGHLQFRGYDLSGKIFHIVREKQPKNGAQRIYGEHVNMLEAMHPFPGLAFTMAKQRTLGDVIINSIDVRISVVKDVVLHLPNGRIAAECIHGQAEDVIDPFVAGETAMASIVHHIECYTH
jgi:hypothetical protein